MTARTPTPVRSPRVLNARKDGFPTGAIYVGRGRRSKLGNPFTIGKHGTRDEVCIMHEEWFVDQSDLLVLVRQLRGCDLVCWCAPERCHADLYLRLANTSWEQFHAITREIRERATRRSHRFGRP